MVQQPNTKNYQKFSTNLIFHENDFNLKAKWRIFPMSHGKNAYGGVGGTLKKFAARASFQRPFSQQILTPKQLFKFANSEITGVTTLFVNPQYVKENISFLEFRFSNCSTLTELARIMGLFHVEINFVLNYVSGAASENLLIQQKENVLSIDTSCLDRFMLVLLMISGALVLCFVRKLIPSPKWFHPNGLAAQFIWPSLEDTCWTPIHDIITKVDPPLSGSTY